MYEGGHQTIGCAGWEQPVVKEKIRPTVEAWRADCGSDRRRSGDLTIFSRTLYQLSYRALRIEADTQRPRLRDEFLHLNHAARATPTGLEPATSAVTGRRANQLRYGALLDSQVSASSTWLCNMRFASTPNGI